MPAITPHSKVLLTGGSGLLGSWVLKSLLDHGFTVLTAVRSQQKADLLGNLFKEHEGQLEFTIVEDFTLPGVFDDAASEASGIIHCGSPMPTVNTRKDPDSYIKPAIAGTLEILKSASQSSEVKRVVYTSSVVAVMEPGGAPFSYDENMWSQGYIKTAMEQGAQAPSLGKYFASKTLAEHAAWEYIKTSSPSFDLVTTLPTLIWGPIINDPTPEFGTNTSIGMLLAPLKEAALGMRKPEQDLQELRCIDVRDLAEQHVQALLRPEAGGERILTSAYYISWKHVFKFLNDDPVDGVVVPDVEPDKDWTPTIILSSEKSQRIFDTKYRPIAQTVRDTVASAIKLGWMQQEQIGT